ncbi:hypothetical protein [Streptomyces sp. CC77]|uniref:hypothetical protein n=1 Tax=Streptomyces sp. CC77 TaxID=1906739 RepID=UPI0008DE30B9|nr:hypothetical protein [Streptomyces sp. CC77]OII70502.1 hypothetical protein BJP39_13200 [Streptomyces sp. CC77]
MSAGHTVTGRRLTGAEAWAEMDRTGKSGACVIGECGYCTPPQDVYVVMRGRPVVDPPVISIRCTCVCHRGRSVLRQVITV